jgi:hypothetical protein
MRKLRPFLLTLAVTIAGILPCARAADFKDFAGTWQTTVPKSVTNKSEDLELTVKFDAKGDGNPRFMTRDGGVIFFTGAVTADLREKDGKTRVVLLREWDVTLGKDKKTMTWTEKGGTKLEFRKQ